MGRQHCTYIVGGFMSYGRTMTVSGCLELWDLITTTHLNLSGSLAKPPLIWTHWGRVTDICVVNLTIIGSDNGLSPVRRGPITWTNVGILLIGTLGTHLGEMLIEIQTLSVTKIHLKMSSGKWRPFCLGLNVDVMTYHCSNFLLLIRRYGSWTRNC